VLKSYGAQQRGGEGNVVEPNPKKKPHKGLADRIKERLVGFLHGNRNKRAGKARAEVTKEEAKKEEPSPTSEITPAAEVKGAAEAEAAKPKEVKA